MHEGEYGADHEWIKLSWLFLAEFQFRQRCRCPSEPRDAICLCPAGLASTDGNSPPRSADLSGLCYRWLSSGLNLQRLL